MPDLVVDEQVVVEVKSAAMMHVRHIAQAKTYLRIGRFPLGYVLHFGTFRLGTKRVVP